MLYPCKPLRRAVLTSLAALLTGAGLRATAQEAKIPLRGNVPPLVATARPLRRMEAAAPLRFSIALPVRNQAGLNDLLRRLYAPGDPQFHHFLQTGGFAARFGATQADYDAVIAYVKAQGLTVAATSPNRLLLQVTGSAAQVEKAFGVRMMRYQASEGRVFHAPDAEPTLPPAIANLVSGIVGLDDALEAASNVMRLGKPLGGVKGGGGANGGSGPSGGYSPNDIKIAYNLKGVSETGTGQTIALFELDGYVAGDITTYEDKFSISHVTVQNVLVDNFSGNPTAPTKTTPSPNGPLEVTLDIELAIALAPGASKILVYEGTSFVDIYNKIANDNTAQLVSSSWYPLAIDSSVSSSQLNSENTAFQQMATQGQSFYAASGDFGDKVNTGTDRNGNPILTFGVQDPSSQPYCCGVGGTNLSNNGAGGAWSSETAWSGSGGGISGEWPLPWYQSEAVSPGSGGSASSRNVPDVALNAGVGYSIYYSNVLNNGGGWLGNVGGTSCAAPLWAAFTARVNQRRINNGLGALGFPDPAIYYLAQTPAYGSDFHDMTSGSNGTYSAVTNYDNVTGFGSFNGGNLIGGLLINGSAFHVDGNYNGFFQFGTPVFPYHTVTQAVNAAPANGVTIIYIKGNTYSENINTNKRLLLLNDGGGTVHIGAP